MEKGGRCTRRMIRGDELMSWLNMNKRGRRRRRARCFEDAEGNRRVGSGKRDGGATGLEGVTTVCLTESPSTQSNLCLLAGPHGIRRWVIPICCHYHRLAVHVLPPGLLPLDACRVCTLSPLPLSALFDPADPLPGLRHIIASLLLFILRAPLFY